MANRRALLTGIAFAMLVAGVLAWWSSNQPASSEAAATARALPSAPVQSPIATTPQTLPLPAGAQPTKPSSAPATLVEAAVAAYRQTGQAALHAPSAQRLNSAGQPMTLLEALKAGDEAARERAASSAQASPFAQGQR
jgi:hypothetical protein